MDAFVSGCNFQKLELLKNDRVCILLSSCLYYFNGRMGVVECFVKGKRTKMHI